LTSPTKEKENPAEAVVVAPAVAEVAADDETPAVAETAPVIPETVVTEPPEETAAGTPFLHHADIDTTPEASKKEKRKSFTGFGTLFKNKSVKEPSPEPTTEEISEVPTEAVVESAVIAPLEPVNPTEDPAAAPAETPKNDKTSKRTSIFGNLLAKKDKSPALTNGEATEPTTTTEDPVPTTTEPTIPPTEEIDPEVSPVTPKKGLGRRLTSQFKSLGRAKSPDKSKAAKVSDEAPKIDTTIESTPESAPAAVADPTPAEPLSTTEAPPAPVDSTPEQPAQPAVVSTLA
jgi:hypothetical protein